MLLHRAPVDHLRPGVFIRLELKWHSHPFAFNSFKIKNMDQIDILKELGLSEVIYIPEKCDCLPVPPDNSPSTDREPTAKCDVQSIHDKALSDEQSWRRKREQIERMKKRHKKLRQCEMQYSRTLGQVKKLMIDIGTGSEEATVEADNLIRDVVQSFLADQESIVHLMNIKAKDENVFYHSLNVVVLSLVLAKECGLDTDQARFLGLGALFHDIGKQRIPKALIYKQTPLTVPERKLLRLHPVYGYEMMSKVQWFDPTALQVIRQHHEKNDGSGYPEGLTQEEISLFAKITSIANTYDNLCNMLDQEQSLTPYEALSYMFRNKGQELDVGLLSLFIRCLGVYPPGTVVKLSNEAIGIVVSANSEKHLRPSVLIYDPTIPRREAIILDLDEDHDLKIEKSIRPAQLPSEVFDYLDPRARVNYFVESEREGHKGHV
jgi:putative nucleotidyltransferase with HDIG domain